MLNVFSSKKIGSLARSLLLVVVAASIVTGCEVGKATIELAPEVETFQEPDLLGSGWSSPAGSLGVIPIAPPSEDVRVGDLFVYPFNPDIAAARSSQSRDKTLSVSPRWGTISLLEELEEEYQLRPAWPKTPDGFLQIAEDPHSREWYEAKEDDGESIFARDRTTSRLRNLGIPEFSTFTLTEGDANTLIPTEAINLVLGSAWNDDKILSIRLSSTETYSLGLNKILSAAIGEGGIDLALKSPYRDHLHLIADPASDVVWLRVLSDVVYVRSMDIIIQSTGAFEEDEEATADEFIAQDDDAGVVIEEVVIEEVVVADGDENGVSDDDAAEESTEALEGDVDVVVEVDIEVVQDDEEIPDHVLDPAYTAFVRANAINELLIESDMDDLPGGFMRFVSITDDSVTLRRYWQRGLAIGARGLTIEVNKITGEILRSAQMGTLIP